MHCRLMQNKLDGWFKAGNEIEWTSNWMVYKWADLLSVHHSGNLNKDECQVNEKRNVVANDAK